MTSAFGLVANLVPTLLELAVLVVVLALVARDQPATPGPLQPPPPFADPAGKV